MSDTTVDLKAQIVDLIETDRDAILALLQDFLRIRSINPPGDMLADPDEPRDLFGMLLRSTLAVSAVTEPAV